MEAATQPELLYLAKVADNIESYNEALEFVEKAAIVGGQPTIDELDIVFRCIRQLHNPNRSAWHSMNQKIEKQPRSSKHMSLLHSLLKKIELEIIDVCGNGLRILGHYLTKPFTSMYTMAMCLRLKGDIHRYICHLLPIGSPDYKASCIQALMAYTEAYRITTQEFSSTKPLRLGVAINFAVYYYEVEGNAKKAIEICEEALKALDDLPQVVQADYKSATELLQKLTEISEEWRIETE